MSAVNVRTAESPAPPGRQRRRQKRPGAPDGPATPAQPGARSAHPHGTPSPRLSGRRVLTPEDLA